MKPYLSVVMGIGGNVATDLQIRLGNCLLEINRFARAFSLSLELILVEWNTKPLGIQLDDPAFPFRIIHTGDAHSRYPNPHGFKYFEMAPKNIGIRRARGEFVLTTNPDDLWSDELAEFFARRELQHGNFYRVNRHDTMNGKVFRVCHSTGCFPPDAPEKTIREQIASGACRWSPDMLHFNASGDFMLMAKDDWFKIHGNPERDYNHTVDGQTIWLAHLKGLKQVVLPYPIYHPDHERTLNVVGGKFVGPPWDDKRPHTKENGEDWGFAGTEFEETVL